MRIASIHNGLCPHLRCNAGQQNLAGWSVSMALCKPAESIQTALTAGFFVDPAIGSPYPLDAGIAHIDKQY
jgi:hypothetical protein